MVQQPATVAYCKLTKTKLLSDAQTKQIDDSQPKVCARIMMNEERKKPTKKKIKLKKCTFIVLQQC